VVKYVMLKSAYISRVQGTRVLAGSAKPRIRGMYEIGKAFSLIGKYQISNRKGIRCESHETYRAKIRTGIRLGLSASTQT